MVEMIIEIWVNWDRSTAQRRTS